MKFLLHYNIEIVINGGGASPLLLGDENLMGMDYTGGIFPGGEMSKFLTHREDSPPSP